MLFTPFYQLFARYFAVCALAKSSNNFICRSVALSIKIQSVESLYKNAPIKLSPAPVVFFTLTFIAGEYTALRFLSYATAPSPPFVTTSNLQFVALKANLQQALFHSHRLIRVRALLPTP